MLEQLHIFFLYCPLFCNQRCTLLNTVNDTNSSFTTNTNGSILTHLLPFGKVSLEISANTLTLYATMNLCHIRRRDLKKLFFSIL